MIKITNIYLLVKKKKRLIILFLVIINFDDKYTKIIIKNIKINLDICVKFMFDVYTSYITKY